MNDPTNEIQDVPADERVFVCDWVPGSALRICFVPLEPDSPEPTSSNPDQQTDPEL